MAFPTVVNHQDYLLSVNIHDQPNITDPETGVTLKPLFLDAENGTWAVYGIFPPGTKLPPHFHTGSVHFFTTKGEWNYVEYPNDVQRPGSYLYEPGGSIHQYMVAEDAKESAEGFMVVSGANINFDTDGNYTDTLDAGTIEAAILLISEAMGIKPPRYIKPQGGSDFSDKS